MSYIKYKTFFNAFTNHTRFEIIKVLRKGQRNVGEIVKETGFEQSRVSHNLKRLECVGFVKCKYVGKNRVYWLDKDMIDIINNIEKYVEKYDKVLKVCFLKVKK
ncbi:MAG: metalloregulator ArsR/SmtB family transcription factor [Nanoarchaeota archaeon]|nr:metalloregulator ArsR/SmtB family transcription factor [Nanoarchaeota archaeon]